MGHTPPDYNAHASSHLEAAGRQATSIHAIVSHKQHHHFIAPEGRPPPSAQLEPQPSHPPLLG